MLVNGFTEIERIGNRLPLRSENTCNETTGQAVLEGVEFAVFVAFELYTVLIADLPIGQIGLELPFVLIEV